VIKLSEKQDRQGVRKASELEQKYNLRRSLDNLNGAVVAATRAATNTNTAAGNANAAASSANAAAEAARQFVNQTDFMIAGAMAEDGKSVELDKSFTEILQAAEQKRKCTVVIDGDGLSIFELVFANANQIRFQQLTQEGVLVSLEISSDEE